MTPFCSQSCSRWMTGRRSWLQSLSGAFLGSFFGGKEAVLSEQAVKNSGSVQLHMYIEVRPGQAGEFEKRYRTVYVPIVLKQKGFRSSRLLRKRDSQDDYEIDLAFESEALRAAWASSGDHGRAWKPMDEVIANITVQGFDVID
jgi:heme-degrading monooxygenase HmoA